MKHSASLEKNAVLLLILLSLALANFTYAQEGTLPPPPEAGAGIPERQNTRAERKTEFTESMHNRILNLSRNVTNRFGSAILRMTNITIRLESRIAKLKSTGIETSPAEAKLAEAKVSLENTQRSMGSFTSAQIGLGGDNTKEVFHTMQTYVRDGRESLILTHTLLRETVALLKEAVQKADVGTGVSDSVQSDNASSTAVLE